MIVLKNKLIPIRALFHFGKIGKEAVKEKIKAHSVLP